MAMLLVQQYLDELGYTSGKPAPHADLYLPTSFHSFTFPKQACNLCSSP